MEKLKSFINLSNKSICSVCEEEISEGKAHHTINNLDAEVVFTMCENCLSNLCKEIKFINK